MIGILGGTFDPIHFGHLRTALDVMQATGMAQMRFIPLHRAVHRAQPETDGSLRLQMVQAAIAGQPGFVADDRELRRQGDSYMVETLASLRDEFPEQPLCLLLGMDAFNGFADWRRPDEILRLAHLVVMHRPGAPSARDPRVQEMLESRRYDQSDALAQAPAGRILLQAVTQLDISATRIRALVAAGQSPRYLLPEAVLMLIESHGLYRGR
jgi:nicotinate-nucleotide adenylyltransferase